MQAQLEACASLSRIWVPVALRARRIGHIKVEVEHGVRGDPVNCSTPTVCHVG